MRTPYRTGFGRSDRSLSSPRGLSSRGDSHTGPGRFTARAPFLAALLVPPAIDRQNESSAQRCVEFRSLRHCSPVSKDCARWGSRGADSEDATGRFEKEMKLGMMTAHWRPLQILC